ncbi:DUF6504 family protein [Nocardioides seonyuensis]|uniref:DUF6504 family protein n=1 Tax=Nocardioides seonyuensis TaxID=2518371 RepID=UPI001421F722|nr:DUF6504 family protein [Nocardioides seonyuensis]
MRQYDDPVEVRRGETEGPDQFLWRGRLWKVRAVLAHWVETGPWWQSAGVRAVVGSDEATSPAETRPDQTPPTQAHTDMLVERELWRVAAGRGVDNDGVFDLSFSWTDGRWQLVGCVD